MQQISRDRNLIDPLSRFDCFQNGGLGTLNYLTMQNYPRKVVVRASERNSTAQPPALKRDSAPIIPPEI
jgi:hypothetical protein